MILMNGTGQRLIFKAQPQVEKFNLELNKKKAASFKLQASSLTVTEGQYRIQIERRNIMEEKLSRQGEQLKRIADALEEILRLVKKDMEPRTKDKN